MRVNKIDRIDSKGKKHYVKHIVNIPCGVCKFCRERKAQEWEMRVQYELQYARSAFFVTLTYDDEHLPYCYDEPCFSKDDVQKFFKRLREFYKQKISKEYPFKYLLISENGDRFNRPHYHAIFFNLPNSNISQLTYEITNLWSKGFCTVSHVALSRVRYLLKYFTKSAKVQNGIEVAEPCIPFMLSSRNPAIGNCDLKRLKNYVTKNDDLCINLNGKNYTISKYHQSKIINKYNKSILSQINQLKFYEKNFKNSFSHKQAITSCLADIQISTQRARETEGQLKQHYLEEIKKYKNTLDTLVEAEKNLTHLDADINPNINYQLLKKLRQCLI